MANFTSSDKLRGILSPAAVDAIFANIPEGLADQVILQIDSLITAKTGIEPAETNEALLERIAGHLAIWDLTGQQQDVVGKEELDRRKNNAADAMALLEQIADGELSIADTTSLAIFSEDWQDVNGVTPRRSTLYEGGMEGW